jgi:hypothetical protein
MTDGAKSRLLNLEQMSPDDWRSVLKELFDKAETEQDKARALRVASVIRVNIDTEHRLFMMDKTSTSLAKKLIWLTWILSFLTALLVADAAHRLSDKPHGAAASAAQSGTSSTPHQRQ